MSPFSFCLVSFLYVSLLLFYSLKESFSNKYFPTNEEKNSATKIKLQNLNLTYASLYVMNNLDQQFDSLKFY